MNTTPPETASGGFSASDLAAEVSNAQPSIRSRLEEGLFIPGTPVAQGSMRAFRNRILHSNDAELRVWRQKITDAIIGEPLARALEEPVFSGAVMVTALYFLPSPKKRLRKYPTGHGEKDLDKLVRALLDGLTLAGVWSDDSTVASLVASKHYALDVELGVSVRISELA